MGTLMLPGERKSVEPMAAKTAPARTAAQHHSLLHFVGIAPWSDEDVLAKVRELVLPAIERREPIEAWIIDDTAFPKQGTPFGRLAPSVLRAAWYNSPGRLTCPIGPTSSRPSRPFLFYHRFRRGRHNPQSHFARLFLRIDFFCCSSSAMSQASLYVLAETQS
jgi:hypothetical protein